MFLLVEKIRLNKESKSIYINNKENQNLLIFLGRKCGRKVGRHPFCDAPVTFWITINNLIILVSLLVICSKLKQTLVYAFSTALSI